MQDPLLTNRDGNAGADTAVREATVVRGANLITKIEETVSIPSCSNLVLTWIARGSNLALAGPFIEHSVDVVRALFSKHGESPIASMDISRDLFHHTSQPIDTENAETLQSLQAQFGHQRCRWEVLGFFFTAAARAAIEMAKFESDRGLRDFQRIFMNLSDLILDIALSLDCLNDLQLLLQYENWLVHSHVDGDQSRTPSRQTNASFYLQFSRLLLLEAIRRRGELHVCFGLPPAGRWRHRCQPFVFTGTQKIGCRHNLLCRQKCVHFLGSSPTHATKILQVYPSTKQRGARRLNNHHVGKRR